MEWTEDMFATEPVLEKIEALEQQLAEAEDKLKIIATYAGKVTPERQYLAEVVEYAKMYFRDREI